jgi:predicted nicotinamide N-methyase
VTLLTEQTVGVRNLAVSLVRPRSAEDLLDEEAFARDEFLPYWAELWPSALALAGVVARLGVNGLRVVELGCGLALPSIAAARGGARVLATDWAPDALAFATLNAGRNGAALETALVRWEEPELLVSSAPWDLVLASDVLYERRNSPLLLDLLPRLGTHVLLADPGRPATPAFVEAARGEWTVELQLDDLLPRGGVYRLRRFAT